MNINNNEAVIRHLKLIIADVKKNNDRILKKQKEDQKKIDRLLAYSKQTNDIAKQSEIEYYTDRKLELMEREVEESRKKLKKSVARLKTYFESKNIISQEEQNLKEDIAKKKMEYHSRYLPNSLSSARIDKKLAESKQYQEYLRTQSRPIKTSKLKKTSKMSRLKNKFKLRLIPSFAKPIGV